MLDVSFDDRSVRYFPAHLLESERILHALMALQWLMEDEPTELDPLQTYPLRQSIPATEAVAIRPVVYLAVMTVLGPLTATAA